MSVDNGKEKLEQDYRELEECVDELTKEEIKKIRKKMEALKQEAVKVGEDVEAELGKSESGKHSKKS